MADLLLGIQVLCGLLLAYGGYLAWTNRHSARSGAILEKDEERTEGCEDHLVKIEDLGSGTSSTAP
jgi:hypothetical protein